MLLNFLTVKSKGDSIPNVVHKRGTQAWYTRSSMPHQNPFICMVNIAIQGGWQRRRDSNPRDPHGPTPLAGERLRPLGHVSTEPFSNEFTGGQEAKGAKMNVCFTSVLRRYLVGALYAQVRSSTHLKAGPCAQTVIEWRVPLVTGVT